jgi:hypothetical protein
MTHRIVLLSFGDDSGALLDAPLNIGSRCRAGSKNRIVIRAARALRLPLASQAAVLQPARDRADRRPLLRAGRGRRES